MTKGALMCFKRADFSGTFALAHLFPLWKRMILPF